MKQIKNRMLGMTAVCVMALAALPGSLPAAEKTAMTAAAASTNYPVQELRFGIVDIVVQHSSDKVNWVDEVSASDMLNEDTDFFDLYDYGVPVISGYYYRVVVTLYAKEQGWFFPDTESIENASTAVWIG